MQDRIKQQQVKWECEVHLNERHQVGCSAMSDATGPEGLARRTATVPEMAPFEPEFAPLSGTARRTMAHARRHHTRESRDRYDATHETLRRKNRSAPSMDAMRADASQQESGRTKKNESFVVAIGKVVLRGLLGTKKAGKESQGKKSEKSKQGSKLKNGNDGGLYAPDGSRRGWRSSPSVKSPGRGDGDSGGGGAAEAVASLKRGQWGRPERQLSSASQTVLRQHKQTGVETGRRRSTFKTVWEDANVTTGGAQTGRGKTADAGGDPWRLAQRIPRPPPRLSQPSQSPSARLVFDCHIPPPPAPSVPPPPRFASYDSVGGSGRHLLARGFRGISSDGSTNQGAREAMEALLDEEAVEQRRAGTQAAEQAEVGDTCTMEACNLAMAAGVTKTSTRRLLKRHTSAAQAFVERANSRRDVNDSDCGGGGGGDGGNGGDGGGDNSAEGDQTDGDNVDWYVQLEEMAAGPVSEEQLKSWYADGTADDETMVWFEGIEGGAWASVGDACSWAIQWERLVDPATGDEYYCDPVRGVVTWERPVDGCIQAAVVQ